MGCRRVGASRIPPCACAGLALRGVLGLLAALHAAILLLLAARRTHSGPAARQGRWPARREGLPDPARLGQPDAPKYVLLLCHRGQFSNRMYCLTRGLRIARALNRSLVLPVFTDSPGGWTDVADYVDLRCFRAHGQAVTFAEFRRQLCRQQGGAPGAVPGEFCAGGQRLQLHTAYSLVDRDGSRCRHRGQSLAAMQELGVAVAGCTELPNVPQPPGPRHRYSLRGFVDSLRQQQGQRVLAFCDTFGVDLFETEAELELTVPRGAQMCGLQPAPALTEAGAWAMRRLLGAAGRPGQGRPQGGDMQQGQHPEAPRYLAAHVRRGDWFYYCAGRRNCFYSIAVVAACLDGQMKAAGLSSAYIATNADARELQMLREGISGRVFFWSDVQEVLLQAGGAGAPAPPALDLRLPQMVPMLEKAICAGAELFAPSRASTFSEQIVDFRNGGLLLVEVDAMRRRGALRGLPRHSRQAHQICGAGGAGGAGQALPPGADHRYLPEAFNHNLVLGRLLELWSRLRGAAAGTALQPSGARSWPGLQTLGLMAFDGAAMAAANRFVAMYASPAFVAVRFDAAPAAGGWPAVLQCISAALSRAGASVLYLSWGPGMQAAAQQQLALQQLAQVGGAKHLVGLLDQGAEQQMAWSLVYRGSGHARHAEPALLPDLHTLDLWVCAKAAVLLAVGGQGRGHGGGVFEEVAGYRRAFGFSSGLDGRCG